jgi:hypothetical protein
MKCIICNKTDLPDESQFVCPPCKAQHKQKEEQDKLLDLAKQAISLVAWDHNDAKAARRCFEIAQAMLAEAETWKSIPKKEEGN